MVLPLVKIAADLITIASTVKEVIKDKRVQKAVIIGKLVSGIALQKGKAKVDNFITSKKKQEFSRTACTTKAEVIKPCSGNCVGCAGDKTSNQEQV